MATVSYNVDFSSYTSEIIMVWYLNSNPTAEVGRRKLPFPNVPGESGVIENIKNVVHIFRFFESAGNDELTTLARPAFFVDPGKGTWRKLQKYFYTVGRGNDHDPEPNTDTLIDERLADADELYLHNRGTGFRKPEDFTLLDDGGFVLQNGELFSEYDEWMVEVINHQDATTTDVSGVFTDINIVTANGTFDDTYKNTHNVAAFAEDSTAVTTFPAFSTIPEQKATFSTFSNAGRYWRLQFNSGDTVVFLGQSVNQITLRKNEKVELIFKAGVCYVIDYEGAAELAGEYVFADKKLINTEYADGSEKNIADYQDLIDRIPAAKVVSYSDWDLYTDKQTGNVTKRYYHNRGKFAVDNVGGKFKLPDIRGQWLRALKNVDGSSDTSMLSQGVGGMWAQEIIEHGHNVQTTGNQQGVNPGRALQRSSTAGSGAEENDPGAGTNKYIRFTGGSEQRTDSTGVLALVRI